ncbi:MAG: MFS transporter [Oceanicaulis sp.]|uniref:spinster family MFS transporter n=1 Tax=Oceanicaulis TaxID=153232 RepID=UPI0003B5A4D5|nr:MULTISPECIES: MFS transporter [Oceanicaulis]MAP49179.1 MFS transporter [Oceanicaulis sp.]HCR66357.1 MFS transporter [Oceanicaulis sp.]|tara:strand:+ start:10081 stop:11448 length:1368 start_codon:yes stop_codon:yes gene_type:complete
MTTQTETETGLPETPPSAKYSAWVLAMLFIVYAFNFLDRQIISILAIPIQEELGLSDRQLGLLGGIAFALLYSTLGVPIAWLADRTKRTWIITISLSVWSGFTALCGLATNFTQLFLARVGVGVGEAGGVAPSYSLIADYFPPQSRARALAIYSLGIPIGSAFGVIAGAQIAGGAMGDNLDWRAAFIIVGILGLLIAPLFKLTVREPKRGGLDAPQRPAVEAELAENVAAAGEPVKAPEKPGIFKVLAILSKKPSFWFLTLGASCSSMMGYGVFFWVPSFFARSFQLDIITTGWLFGAILFVGGSLGIILGGVLGDLMGKGSKRMYAIVPAVAFFVTYPFYVAGVLAPSALLAVLLFMIPTGLGLAWLGPTLSAFQHLVPPNMRSMASAIFLLINNLLGIGVGVYALGELSTLLTPSFGEEALRYSIMIGATLYLVAGGLFLIAARTIVRDWEEA